MLANQSSISIAMTQASGFLLWVFKASTSTLSDPPVAKKGAIMQLSNSQSESISHIITVASRTRLGTVVLLALLVSGLAYIYFGKAQRDARLLKYRLVIFVLIIFSVLVAQSRRNCEVPGSTWIPCIWGSPLNHHNKHRFSE